MIRKVSALKKRLDIMMKNSDIILDHGTGSYQFTGYKWFAEGYEEKGFEGKNERIYIYYHDSEENKEKLYMMITDEDLRKPKGENDNCRWFIRANWEKEYPNILELKVYEFKEWMEKCGLV